MSNSSPSSASAIVAKAASGWHDLKIEGHSLTKGLGIGEFIRSETFVIAGHRWRIRYYPNGAASDDADWIAVYVHRENNTDGKYIMVKLHINILDHDGEPVHALGKRSNRFDRCGPQDAVGFDRLAKRRDLEESRYLKDDCFSIRSHLTVRNEILTKPNRRHAFAPASNLHRHLLDLLTSQQGHDISFKVGGETFPAHRYIVAARSPVFMAELLGPMKEKAAACIRIDGMEAKVFKAMLHFIYADSLPKIDEDENVEMAQHLLVAADRYNLERLKLMCEETLCKSISKDTAATTLALAEQHGCDGLKKSCFEFLASVDNLKAVMASDGFAHLKSSCPSILEVLVTNLAR
ncbi:BTB/POZ and MATH domain-containing protein 1-like [Triticum dicoccoides]|uniref:BTB/POZ and MATH domain-containing protein 1-like n=1 Tax=Triticum dicoccoides TaxID=85692 RepID=UPI00188DDE34|nr:BTB/POZ and MATH domain-containing protein 1-like [Triticum dicoccoides]